MGESLQLGQIPDEQVAYISPIQNLGVNVQYVREQQRLFWTARVQNILAELPENRVGLVLLLNYLINLRIVFLVKHEHQEVLE